MFVRRTTAIDLNSSHRRQLPRLNVTETASNPNELHKKEREAKVMAQDLLEKQQATVEDVLREVSRIKSVVSDAVEEGVESALRAVKQGRDAAEQGVESTLRAVKHGREAAEDMVHDARSAIKRNPLQAAGIVFAAGLVLGGLLTLVSVNRD
jgi:ElaB/YqjD/DUF883 family membrane-anchored ribosome-binding protein